MKKMFFISLSLLLALLPSISFGAFAFQPEVLSDVGGHMYEEMIEFLQDEEIVSGYPDGSFKPDDPVNRVEYLKVVLESAYDEIPAVSDNCGFDDVEAGAWYTKYICKGVEEGIVNGYPDGTFRPTDQVSFVEAAKISALGYDYELPEFSGDDPWYMPYVSFASDGLLIPPDVDDLDKKLSRGQMSEFLGRAKKYVDGDLADYLEGAGMDFVFFDVEQMVLDVVDDLMVVIEDYLKDLISSIIDNIGVDTDDVDWIDTDSIVDTDGDGVLDKYTFDGGDGLSGYYQVTTDNPDVLTGEIVGEDPDGNSFRVDLAGENTGWEVNYSGDDGDVYLSSLIDGAFSLGEDDGSAITFPDGTGYSQSMTATWPSSEIIYYADQNTFTERIVNETGPVLYISDLGDGVYSENVRIFDEGLDFSFESTDLDGDGVLSNSENWSYTDPLGAYSISQAIEDDYYHELFSLDLGNSDHGADMNLLYEGDNCYEEFSLADADYDMSLGMSMSGGDYSEMFEYYDGELSVAVNVDEIGTTDFAMDLSDGYDELYVYVSDNVIENLSYTVTDGDAQMFVSYDNSEGYGLMNGTLMYPEGFANEIFQGGFMSNEVAMGEFGFEGDKISVSDQGVYMNGDFGSFEAPIALCDETDSWVLGEGKLTWEKMMESYLEGQRKKAEGSFGWGQGGYLSGFDLDLDLGDDEEEVDGANPESDDLKWNKKTKLTLNPFTSYDDSYIHLGLDGTQTGKVRGYGLDKWWEIYLGLGLDLDGDGVSGSAKPKAEQDFTYTNGKFKKDHHSYTDALTWEIMQKFNVDWTIGGARFKKDNTTSLINGILNGEQGLGIDTADFGKEMVSTYGTGKSFKVGQEVDFNIPGRGKKSVRVTTGGDNKFGYEQQIGWSFDESQLFGPGSGWTGGVRGFGGYNGHIWQGGAGLTGQHESGFIFDVSVIKGEGGKPEVIIGFGWGVSF